ncbi:MAG: hypothetical protein ABIO70_01100 [Pseudomonadota bacterium]
MAKTYAALEDPGADYERVTRYVADADYPAVGAVVLDRSCTPAPCVLSMVWDPSGEGFEQFQQDLMLSLYQAGEGVGQPILTTAEQEDGTTRAWVYWNDDSATPEVAENLSQSALIRIRAAGGPAM